VFLVALGSATIASAFVLRRGSAGAASVAA
jgi:hypothetical protein